MNNKIKKFLDNLGLDIRLYGGYFVTNTKIVAKVDRTIVHIALNFKGYRAYPLESKVV